MKYTLELISSVLYNPQKEYSIYIKTHGYRGHIYVTHTTNRLVQWEKEREKGGHVSGVGDIHIHTHRTIQGETREKAAAAAAATPDDARADSKRGSPGSISLSR